MQRDFYQEQSAPVRYQMARNMDFKFYRRTDIKQAKGEYQALKEVKKKHRATIRKTIMQSMGAKDKAAPKLELCWL